MSSNTADEMTEVFTAPPSTPEQATGSPSAELVPFTAPEQTSVTVVGARDEVVIADNKFNIFVGHEATRFVLDINDLRRESELFRNSTCITSVELRRENPKAVRLIYNWFDGHIGEPPLSLAARDLFVDAARIAKQLGIKECESQLLVVVSKTTSTLSNALYMQMQTNTPWSAERIAAYLIRELSGYMFRSPNTGGEDDSEDEVEGHSESAEEAEEAEEADEA